MNNFKINFFIFFYKYFKSINVKKIKFLNYQILLDDFKSFYYEVIYIFKDKIYDFETNKKEPVIIDGGACIGTSIFYFKKKFPNSKIVAFEPSIKAFDILKKNIVLNKIDSVELFNYGLYDTETNLSFSNNQVDSGRVESSGESIIKTVKLSSYINGGIDFLKLNIEGAEYNVFKDLDDTGKINNIKELCFEWHSFAGCTNQNLDKILFILNKNGFKYNISSLSTSNFGKFKAELESEYFLIIYAKKHNI